MLAARRPDDVAAGDLERPGLTVDVVPFDAADTAGHEAFVATWPPATATSTS